MTIKLLSLVIAVFAATACANSGEILGLSPGELEQRAMAGDFAFLDEVEDPRVSARAYRELDPGTGYYVARALVKHGYPDTALRVLQYESEHGEEPWRLSAALWLVEELAERGRYEELADVAGQLIGVYPEEPVIYHAYARALYRLNADVRLEQLLSQIASRDDAVGTAFSAGSGDLAAEAALWRAVLAYRSGRSDWRDRFDYLYQQFAPGEVHSRVYLFAIARPELYRELGPKRRALYEGKHHLHERRFSDAWTALKTALDEGGATLLSRQLIHDVGLAGEQGGGWREASERFKQLENEAPSELLPVVKERLGRQYRVGGAQADAVRVLREAHALDPANERVVWYLLSASSRFDHAQFVRDLRAVAPLMETAGYYDDIFEAVASRMVAAADWTELWDTYAVVEEHGTARMRARYAFILALAVAEHGFLPAEYSGRDREVVKRELFAHAANQSVSPYYSIVARAALGRDLELLSKNGSVVGHSGAGSDSAGVPLVSEVPQRRVAYQFDLYELERLVAGYFQYGLYEHGYRVALRNSALMSSSGLMAASAALRDQEMHIEALRLLGRARRHPEFVLDRERAELLYPLPYREELEAVVERERLDWSVFYALVREESHFAAEVISHAGAIGLSQLMPATAGDIAARMGLDNPVFTDPGTNLMIGGYYLRSLLDRFPTVMHALAAYNGGQGRVRAWQRGRPHLGQFLFHEAIPFSETREYVRKILVSAVYYGHLYEERSGEQVIATIFPQLSSLR